MLNHIPLRVQIRIIPGRLQDGPAQGGDADVVAGGALEVRTGGQGLPEGRGTVPFPGDVGGRLPELAVQVATQGERGLRDAGAELAALLDEDLVDLGDDDLVGEAVFAERADHDAVHGLYAVEAVDEEEDAAESNCV